MAYKVLGQRKNFTLPVYVRGILDQYPDTKVLSYGEACTKYNVDRAVLFERSEFGFTMVQGGRRIILYNERKGLEIIRFTLAHELGHCVLGHISDDDISNKEANCFARNLLCPIPVIKELRIESVNDYMEIFAVSEPMAAASMSCASWDYKLIEETLYCRIKDLLIGYTKKSSRSELHGYPDNVIPFSISPERNTYQNISIAEPTSSISYGCRFAVYVADEEKELLDRLKMGE